jgi:hypothetical protein
MWRRSFSCTGAAKAVQAILDEGGALSPVQATDDIAHSPKNCKPQAPRANSARPELVGWLTWQLPSAAFVNLLSIYSRVIRGGDPQSDAVALDGNDGEADVFANDDLLPYLARENKHDLTFLRGHHRLRKRNVKEYGLGGSRQGD